MPLTATLLDGDLYYQIEARYKMEGGAYVVRALGVDGAPAVVPRALGEDRTGTLYIGKANSFVDRVLQLKKSVSPDHETSTHPVAARLADHPAMRATYPPRSLVVDLHPDPDPIGAERALFRAYFDAFGEPPPLNRMGETL